MARVLFVGQEQTTREKLVEHLLHLGYEVDVALDTEEIERHVRKASYEVALIDVRASVSEGLRWLQHIHRRNATTQVIALVQHHATAEASEALHRGAYHYLPIPVGDLSLATEIVRRAAEKAELISQNKELADKMRHTLAGMEQVSRKLERLATRDELTELQNQRHFQETLAIEISRGQRYTRTFSILLIDIDLLSSYVKAHGEKAGDLLIYSFAQLIKSVLRTSDTVARYGGDEFAVLLPETDHHGANELVGRLHHVVSGHVFPGVEAFPSGRLNFHAGIATFPEHGNDSASLLDHAFNSLELITAPK